MTGSIILFVFPLVLVVKKEATMPIHVYKDVYTTIILQIIIVIHCINMNSSNSSKRGVNKFPKWGTLVGLATIWLN